MPKTRRASHRPEMWSRTVEIISFRTTVRLYAVTPKGEEPYIDSQPWLELDGTMDEPVRNVRDVVMNMYPKDKLEVGTARPASVGAIVQMRPHLSVVVTFPQTNFDRVWTLALGGRLKYGHLYFTKPHYNTALVVSMSLSNELEE